MSIIFHFVDNQSQNGQTLQYIQAELYERLKEFSEQIKEDGVFHQNSLKVLSQYVIEEVIVGTNALAFRLQDGRVCRTSYTIKSEKPLQRQEKVQKRLSKGVLEKIVHFGNNNTTSNNSNTNTNSSNRSNPPPTSNVDSIQSKSFPTSRSSGGGGSSDNNSSSHAYIAQAAANSSRNSLPHRIARYQMLSSSSGHSSSSSAAAAAAAAAAPRVNFIREMQRQGIYFARTFSTPIAASEVPEELIEQCQTVLQGKSRQLITRELQRTNLDVNMAVNNLLSRDDEAEENGGMSAPDDWEEADDLLSLLDHADNPLLDSAIGDGIGEDIFPSIRLRRESLYSSMASDIESFADRRKRRRLDCQLRNSVEPLPRSFPDASSYVARSGNESPTFSNDECAKSDSTTVKKNCLVLGSTLEFWKEKSKDNGKGKDIKFTKIAGMYSELVGITTDNELHQWRWCDCEPWNNLTESSNSTVLQNSNIWNNGMTNSSGYNGSYNHPRIPSLNLFGEKIIKLSACSSRATVLTSSGKLATWVDETIAPIFQVLRNSDQNFTTQNLRIEHAVMQFVELKDENIVELFTSSLVSAVRCHSGNIYWWGVIPFKYRKSAMEKNRDRTPKSDSKYSGQRNKRNNNTSNKDMTNIIPGSFVCMRNAPIFHAGAIGFTVVGGVPKIGTLLEDAWKIEDICRFSVRPVQSLVNERRNCLPNSVQSINPASFDPLTHAHMCPQLNTSFLYGLLGSSNKTINIAENNQNSNDGISGQGSTNNYKMPSTWAEMPPPPSPASSTCSDQSGPVKISPGTFKRKKQSVNNSGTGDLVAEVNTESRPVSNSNNRSTKPRSNDVDKCSNTPTNLDYEPLAGHKRPLTPDDKSNGNSQSQSQEEEEDWCLKDVIFLEDGRTQPVGVVLKVDGSIAAVKFLKDSERACVAVNCLYSPLAAVFGNNNSSCAEPTINSNTPNSPDPISWLNDCRLLRKEELVVVKQPLVSRVPDIVQKHPKCIPAEIFLDTKPSTLSSNFGILGMALENELIHLLIRKTNSSKSIEYKLLSLGKKIISSHRLNTSANGFLGRSPQPCLIASPLESEYFELKNGMIFNAERHRPIFLRDGNGTVYPLLFNESHSSNTASSKSEPIPSPHWLDLPPVRCVDFGFVNVTNGNNKSTIISAANNNNNNNSTNDNTKNFKNKTNRMLIGVLVLESQTLMHHILRADDKKVSSVMDNLSAVSEYDSLVQKIINEKLDGQRNIIHVAINMCQPRSNVETEWKLSHILSYRSKKTSTNSNVEDLSQRSNWSLEHSMNISSFPYRRWIDMGRPLNDSGIFNYSRSNDRQASSVRFTVMSSSNTSRNSILTGDVNTGWMLPPVHLDEKEKRSNSYRIINIIINHQYMENHLVTLLSQRNADGQTPFMQAVSQRIYPLALFLFDCILDLCDIQYVSVFNTKSQLALSMIFPAITAATNKNLLSTLYEDNPLQVLCQNDGCSFTWTGPDHIRQDIFECRTCGLTESLCCCTECARVCHKGHDCHLKKTSPTAYCDCWEKCRCKALVVGDNACRQELLKKLLHHTDLATLQNRRKEHLLLFLVKTVDRQFREHKQIRTSGRRHATSVLNARHGNIGSSNFTSSSHMSCLEPHHPAYEPPMPEYGLEPSNFALNALDSVLSNWPSVETLLISGDRSDWVNNLVKNMDPSTRNNGINPITDDEVFLNYQSFSEQLDQFVFTLIAKTASSSVDILLNTLNKELQNEKSHPLTLKPPAQTKVKTAASRLVRSVARVFVSLQLQMAPDFNLQSKPLDVCKRIFENLLFVSLSELPRIAADIIAPVRCGLLKPTASYSHFYQISDAVRNLDQIFYSSNSNIDNRHDSPGSPDKNVKPNTQSNRVTESIGMSRSTANSSRRTSNNNRNNATSDSNSSNSATMSDFHGNDGLNSGSTGHQNRRRPYDDDVDGSGAVISISDNNSVDTGNRNMDLAPPARRRRQSTPISLSSRMNTMIDEEDDDDGHSSGDDNWNSNNESRPLSEDRQHSHQLNSIFFEESDGDGNTIEGENDLDGDVDMEVYDEDHDTDIVPETESDSDDSISSSICVTEYNPEPINMTELSNNRSNEQQSLDQNPSLSVINMAESDMRMKEDRSNGMDINTDISETPPFNNNAEINSVRSTMRKSINTTDNKNDTDNSILSNDSNMRMSIDDGIRYSVVTSTDQPRTNAESTQSVLVELVTPLASASNLISQPTLNNATEWFRNQVDLDAISDDESDDDESSQNTEDDEQDDLNESATDLSQPLPQHAQRNNTNSTIPDNVANSENQPNLSANNASSPGNSFCGLQTTQVQLARAFCCLIKLLAGLLNQMYYSREKNAFANHKEYDRFGLNLGPDNEYGSSNSPCATLSQSEEEHVMIESSQQLGPIWIWICQSMDFLESQVCFANAFQRKHGIYKARPVPTFEPVNVLNNPNIGSSSSTDANRTDFLKYVVSMMRASSDEHGDQTPTSLNAVNYCHLAYLVDALLYLMRICFGMVTEKVCCDGVDTPGPTIDDYVTTVTDHLKREPTLVQEEVDDEQEDLNSLRPTIGSECGDSILDEDTNCPTLTCNYQSTSSSLLKPQINHRRDCQQKIDTSEDSFFCRTDYPQGWVGLGADPFHTPVSESLPLAHMPQLLQPPGPSDEVFGVLRRFEIDQNSGTNQNFCGRSNEGQLPLHMGFSSRWADRLLDNNIIFSGVPVGNLRTRWRYSLELLSNSFEQNVGLEPGSVLVDFTHFSLKETRFRKEMEKLRNQCRRDLSLVVNRERNSVICDTVTQLNTEFSRRNSTNTSTPLMCHRFKVKFNDEPGEGNGVARSFLTVFAEAVLSEELLLLNSAMNSQKKQPSTITSRGSLYNRNEHNYIRMSAISRISTISANTSSNISQSSYSIPSNSWYSDALSIIGMNHNNTNNVSRNFRPAMRIISNPQTSQANLSNVPSTRSIIRSDISYTNTAHRLISAIAIFASSTPIASNSPTSHVWGITSSSSNLNNSVPQSTSINYSQYSIDNLSDRGNPRRSINMTSSRAPATTMSVLSTTPFSSSSIIGDNSNPISSHLHSISNSSMRSLNSNTDMIYSSSQIPISTTSESDISSSNQLGNLDPINLATGFTANLGNQAPIWVSSNWLPMYSSSTSISNPMTSLTNLRRIQNYSPLQNPVSRYPEPISIVSSSTANIQLNQSINIYDTLRGKIAVNDPIYTMPASNRIPDTQASIVSSLTSLSVPLSTQNISIFDILRSRIPGDDSLIQQMAYNLTAMSGRSDLNGLLNQLSTKSINMNDIINNLMNSMAQVPRFSDLNQTESTIPYNNIEGSSETTQSIESNMEVSIITFAIYLDSLLNTNSNNNLSTLKTQPEDSTLINESRPSNTILKRPTMDPEQTPLFWQPGHPGFYCPRRVNLIDNNHEYTRNNIYRSVGRVIGISLLMNETMPLKLSRHVLKYILGLPIGWHDFAFFNCQLYESLRQLMKVAQEAQLLGIAGSPEDHLLEYNLNFTIVPREEEGGSGNVVDGKPTTTNTINLIPNGEEVDVDSNNVFQYVKKYCITRMITIVKPQLDQIKNGVYDVLPKNVLNGLSPEDLRLLLNGTDEIDIEVLVSYTSFLDESSCTISNSQEKVAKFKKWFWQVLLSFNSIQRQNLIYFWTSSPALPASNQGFQPMPTITIRPADDLHLPTANTCISRLYIPLYSTKLILREKLLQAIETKSFGFV